MNTKFLNTSFEFLKKTIYNSVHKDAAKMLIGMGAFGFALSSLAQCFAIEINDKIDNKKKKFLLRQEIADGAVNIGLFLAITSSVWKLSDKLLTKIGILNTKENLNQIRSGGRILTTTIASIISCNIITPFVRNLIAGEITAYKDKKSQDLKPVIFDTNKNLRLNPFNDFYNWKINSTISNKTNSEKTNSIFKGNYGSISLNI